MDPRIRSQHASGVRPGVWLFAAACLLAALGIAAGLTRRVADRDAMAVATSGEEPAVAVAVEPRGDTAPAASAEPEPTPTQPAIEDAPPSAPPLAIAMARADAPGDSRLAAEIRVLEAEAARVAESLDLGEVPLDAAPRGAAPRDPAAEDARVRQLADALLVEYFVQDAYRGTEFPMNYPAEERTRAAAESQVRGLSPEMRRDLLDVALQSGTLADPVAPSFAPPESGLVWEGASR